jgi:hypothetical protein
MDTQLTIADLASIHQLIDAACTRGAFKAAEMRAVGETYDKLTRFLEAVKQQAEQQEQAQQSEAQLPQGEENA